LDVLAQVFIYGDSLQSFLVAVFVPDKPNVLKWAKEKGNFILLISIGHDTESMSDEQYEKLINSEEFHNYLTELITKTRKSENLTGLEVPKKFYCTSEEFKVENDLLTPTFKLKRNEAKKKYYSQIKDMYDGEKLQGE
jgi:long-chain acyl-CoA synthetase